MGSAAGTPGTRALTVARVRYFLFGRLLPALTFTILAGMQVVLISASAGSLLVADFDHLSLLLGRVLSLAVPVVMLWAVLARRPARDADHALGASVMTMYGTFVPLAIPLIQRLFDLPPAAPDRWQVVSADLLLVVGSGFSLWALGYLGTSFSILPEARALRTAGPYALVRHPLYLAEIMVSIGTGLLFSSTWVWLAVLSFAATQAYRARREERVLARTFDDYADYRARTGMILPRLGRHRGRPAAEPNLLVG
ncbi:MAG: hypothetical protein QOE92_1338 [Chloroflexota bacterium]|jgi:protein-S-isoprenylcysteine O-methyltransferase Ste14|nr:hypothetical protein [Chloroflexota bacterium]